VGDDDRAVAAAYDQALAHADEQLLLIAAVRRLAR
jgi:hypothetical protein